MSLSAQPKLSSAADMVERRRALWRTLDERSIAHYERFPGEKGLFESVLVRRAAMDPEYALTLYRDYLLGSKGYMRLQSVLQAIQPRPAEGVVPVDTGYSVRR